MSKPALWSHPVHDTGDAQTLIDERPNRIDNPAHPSWRIELKPVSTFQDTRVSCECPPPLTPIVGVFPLVTPLERDVKHVAPRGDCS